jgi:VanZ family protein
MSVGGNMQSGPLVRNSKLVGYLTVTYLVLVVYTSLHPFSQWRAPAREVRVFLTAPWPAYFTWADLALNVLAYVPVGAFLTLVLMSVTRAGLAVFYATTAAICLSLLIEVAQVFLPGRIPANADLLCNATGAFAGAMLVRTMTGRSLLSGGLYRLRERLFHAGTAVDICFLLLALWLATQFSAEIRLFGNGDVRHLLPTLTAVGYSPRTYVLIEAGITGLNFCGVALMLTMISRTVRGAAASVAVFMLCAVLLKSLASNVLFISGNSVLWVTPGALLGIVVGGLLWVVLIAAPLAVQIACATTSIALGMALVNAAPENPYLDATLRVWQHGHYASLNDLTYVLSSAWPFAAIAFLTYAGYRLR